MAPTSPNSLYMPQYSSHYVLKVFICFHFLSFVRFHSALLCISSTCSLTTPKQQTVWLYPTPERGQGKTEPLENAIFLFLISRSIRSGQRWVPWQYVYLYILWEAGKKKSAYQYMHLGRGLGLRIEPHLIWKIMLCMAILLYIMAIWDQGLFLQCTILQARANSILWPASSSSSCLGQAGALHNNVVSCPQMLFHRPRLISQTSPLLQFPKLLFPSLLPTRFHYVFRM